MIRKSKHLDEVMPKMNPQQASKQFKLIKRWQAKHQQSLRRKGGFLLFSQEMLAYIKAEMSTGESSVNGRDPAALKVIPQLINIYFITH